MLRLAGIAVLLTGLSVTTASADVESGPAVDEAAPKLKVYAVVGDVQDKELDFVALRKGKPTIYVFIQAKEWSRPMARYLRKLDETVAKTENAAIVAVWLTDDKQKTKAYLPRAQMSLKLNATAYTLYANSQEGPDGWGINADAFLTTAVTNKGKVTATFAYLSVNETDVPKVTAAFQQALKPAP
jgi:hypothetical protein